MYSESHYKPAKGIGEWWWLDYDWQRNCAQNSDGGGHSLVQYEKYASCDFQMTFFQMTLENCTGGNTSQTNC